MLLLHGSCEKSDRKTIRYSHTNYLFPLGEGTKTLGRLRRFVLGRELGQLQGRNDTF
jgi:hypothetical protein